MFLYRWPKFLKILFEVVHTYYRSFSRKIHIHMENLLNGYFYYSSFISDFLSKYFQELLFVAGERKIYKIYQRKLKLADKLWALEIAYLKLCICRQLFCIRQTSQFSQFYRVSPAELCALLINVIEKLYLINSEANLQSPQHLNRSFLWHKLLPLNYCHKEIYYRCCRCPRYASETSSYKKF